MLDEEWKDQSFTYNKKIARKNPNKIVTCLGNPKKCLLRVEMKETIGKESNDVETASPKEKQEPVNEKMPTAEDPSHPSEDKDKRELHTIRRVNTLKSQLTKKEDLGSKS